MPSAWEQADGNWLSRFGHSGLASKNIYHRFLKKGRNRAIRHAAKILCRQEVEPPKKYGYRGWES